MAAVSFVPFFGGMKLIVFMSKILQKSCSYQLSSKELPLPNLPPTCFLYDTLFKNLQFNWILYAYACA